MARAQKQNPPTRLWQITMHGGMIDFMSANTKSEARSHFKAAWGLKSTAGMVVVEVI